MDKRVGGGLGSHGKESKSFSTPGRKQNCLGSRRAPTEGGPRPQTRSGSGSGPLTHPLNIPGREGVLHCMPV